MSIPEEAYYNIFNFIPSIGPIRFNKLIQHFPSLEAAWGADIMELRRANIEDNVIKQIKEYQKNINPEKEWEKIIKENVVVITKKHPQYPKLLLETVFAPEILYLKGTLQPDEFCLGIVGSRKVTEYGKIVTTKFSQSLSSLGITIVSGMAYGVDYIAQNECVKQQKRTIAVLGNGLDSASIYPKSNRALAEKITQCGCLISEYPLGTPPLKQHFPARNRIISGLTEGILIVEASLSSGSLITANFALEQNREVFAIPGNIYSPNSVGTNNLIKMGATLVSKPEDILEVFNVKLPQTLNVPTNSPSASSEEQVILDCLSLDQALYIDVIAKKTEIQPNILSSLLTLMEIKGMVRDVGGNRYVKT